MTEDMIFVVMSLMRQLAGDTVIYGMGRILSKVLHFVVVASYLTHIFSDEQDLFAIYSDFYFWTAVLYILFTHRMETTLFRYGTEIADRQRAYHTALWSVLSVATVVTILLAILAPALAEALGYPGKGRYVCYFCAILMSDAIIAIPMARLRLEGMARRFAVLNIANVLILIISFVFFFEVAPRLFPDASWLRDDYRLDYVFLSNVLSSGVIASILFPGFAFLKGRDITLWKKMLRYAWPLIIVAIAGVINQSVSVPLQKGYLSGDLESNLYWVGVYAACLKIAILLNLMTTAYNFAAEPFFFQQRNSSDDKQIYADATRAFALVASLIVAASLLLLPWLRHIIDEGYWEGLYIVPPMLVGFYLLGLYYNFSIWFKLTDTTRAGALLSGVGAAVSIVVSIIFLPRWGISASVIAALSAYASMSLLCLLWGQQKFPVPYTYARLIIYPLLALGTYYAVEYFIPETNLTGMLGRIVVLALYSVILIGSDWRFLRRSFARS